MHLLAAGPVAVNPARLLFGRHVKGRDPWSLVVALLLLAACPRRPLSFGPQGQIQDPNEIVKALAARSAKLHRLRSEVSFSADSARGRGSTSGLVAAERPAHLHLELDDFFGNPAAVLTTEGTTLGLYQASSNTFATGPASPYNVARLVPIELPVNEAVDLLFGDPQPLGPRVQSFFVDRARYSYALLFTAGNGAQERRQRIDVDTETLVPVGETVEGWEPFEARFSELRSRFWASRRAAARGRFAWGKDQAQLQEPRDQPSPRSRPLHSATGGTARRAGERAGVEGGMTRTRKRFVALCWPGVTHAYVRRPCGP